ncbi:hypothetical protein LEP3755_50560 [Leptolyngbya sp. NIES-3755]|nr:hypothetical protein LEP3755_50560 [Leptolyngbya sp. NIES-3755]
MKAVEVTGEIDAQGNLTLDQQIPDITNQRVRVIILASETENDFDPDDPPVDAIKANLQKALHQVRTGQTLPLSQMWEGIE